MTKGQRDYIFIVHNTSVDDSSLIKKLKEDWKYGDLDCVFSEDLSGVFSDMGIGYLYTDRWDPDLFVSFDWASPVPYSYDWVVNKYTGTFVDIFFSVMITRPYVSYCFSFM